MALSSMFYIAVGTLFLRRELHWDNAETEMITYGWIGLHHSESEWRWSRGNLMANFTPWATGEPQTNKHCAYKKNLQLLSDECRSDHTVNCVDEPLVLVRDNKTWEEALEYCRTLKIYPHSVQHYELTQLLSADHLHNAQDILQSANVTLAWVGLRYLGDQWSLQVYGMIMYRTLLLLLPLLCVGATGLKKIIHRIEKESSWNDAQAYCREHHVDLLTIRDQAENDHFIENGWIGFYRESGSRTWNWSSGDVSDYVNMRAEELYQEGEHCGRMADGRWYSESCSHIYPYYCEDELVLVEQKKTWEEALEHCRHLTQYDSTVNQNHFYDLVSLTLDTVYFQDIFPSEYNKMWIGLRFLGDYWIWLNGQPEAFLDECSLTDRCGVLKMSLEVAPRENQFLVEVEP
ncbi:hypothetical protein WMY93_003475 [Mugilogobius chulae]|uniref:C-type lectin domain-containing protein n=1 Tax=Mugilogobius chulae TaxID=88201 RepID=A0AAW0PZH4_9GOBI